jgi:hypothetical protein
MHIEGNLAVLPIYNCNSVNKFQFHEKIILMFRLDCFQDFINQEPNFKSLGQNNFKRLLAKLHTSNSLTKGISLVKLEHTFFRFKKCEIFAIRFWLVFEKTKQSVFIG